MVLVKEDRGEKLLTGIAAVSCSLQKPHQEGEREALTQMPTMFHNVSVTDTEAVWHYQSCFLYNPIHLLLLQVVFQLIAWQRVNRGAHTPTLPFQQILFPQKNKMDFSL